jgi:hypothetical protein
MKKFGEVCICTMEAVYSMMKMLTEYRKLLCNL